MLNEVPVHWKPFRLLVEGSGTTLLTLSVVARARVGGMNILGYVVSEQRPRTDGWELVWLRTSGLVMYSDLNSALYALVNKHEIDVEDL